MMSLMDRFREYFLVELARTPAQKSRVYRIRYRVYCEQFQYEPAEQFPTGEEFDEFDARSEHCLIVHRRTGRAAACVRVVPALGDAATDPLPIERVFADRLDQAYLAELGPDRGRLCEVSRLAVDEAFRRRAGEACSRHGEPVAALCGPHERSTFPFICMAGFLGATALTELTGRTNVFAMMEPFLARMLARSGIVFRRVGGDLDYHGIRAPYFTTTQSALEGMEPEMRSMYESIADEIRFDYDRVA